MKFYKAQYMVIKFIPDILKDEPINIGLVMQCPDELYMRCTISEKKIQRIRKYNDEINANLVSRIVEDLQDELNSDNWICRNKSYTNFRDEMFLKKLSSTHANQIQFTNLKGVLTQDLDVEFNRIFEEIVFKEVPKTPYNKVEEKTMKKRFRNEFARNDLIKKGLVKEDYVEYGRFGEEIKIDFSYLNGKRNFVQNISFDVKTKDPMDYAKLWLSNYEGIKSDKNKDVEVKLVYFLPDTPNQNNIFGKVVDCLSAGSDELIDYKDDERINYFIRKIEQTAHK